jgi:hypothetical protein
MANQTERRRSRRIKQDVTIQLVSMQPGAHSAVAQPARAIEVSDHGALLECRSKFELGAEVMVHNPKNLQNGLFKVVRAQLSPSGAAWNIGVELQEISPTDFWGLS